MCHEYGMHQKQSSCVMMAKSMETTITKNVMFNAASAAESAESVSDNESVS